VEGDPHIGIDWRLVAEARPLSVPEQVAERISQAILHGDYQPGQRIPEQSIADQYQISRGPVREALRLLESEGVIEILPRRGAHITSLTVEEVTDIFNIRAALIGLSVRLASENMQPDQLSQMKSWVSQLGNICTEPDATEEYVWISFRVSLFVGRICGNERLYEMLRSLSRQTVRYTTLGLATPARRRRSAKNWRAMLRAIQQGDGDAAERASRTLVEESRDAAISSLESEIASNQGLAL
jgi:DNA-binding GntR family transcriptional regulator